MRTLIFDAVIVSLAACGIYTTFSGWYCVVFMAILCGYTVYLRHLEHEIQKALADEANLPDPTLTRLMKGMKK